MSIIQAVKWCAENANLIAVVGAAIAIGIKFEHRLPKHLHRLLFYGDIAIIVVILLLGFFKSHLDAEWTNRIEQQVKEERNQRERIKSDAAANAKKAESDLKGLQEELEGAKERLRQETQRADSLDNRATHLESITNGRVVTDKQKQLLGSILKFAQRGPISITANASDQEAVAYLQSIRSALVDCGYTVERNLGMILPGPDGIRPGLMLFINDKGSEPPYAQQLLQAFDFSGVNCTAVRKPGTPVGQLEIFIGPKP